MKPAACALAILLAAGTALAQMPDLRSMSGMSMPAPDLPDGSVSVRVVRNEISNNLSGVTVEIEGAGAPRSMKTGPDGHAVFSGLPPGSTVRAVATVDGQRLESQPIEVPATGGVRTILARLDAAGVTATPGASAAAPPPAAGPVSSELGALSLGGNSRVATEFNDDILQVFLLLEIVNRSSSPVSPATALVFDMPTGAEGTTVLEGSTPRANAKGPRVTVPGPFAPGSTPLQIAYRIDTFGKTLTLEQRLPLPLDAVTIAVQRVGEMKVTSPQVERTIENPIERAVFVMGTGPRLEAGKPLTITLDGLPHHSRVPVYGALALVVLMVVGAAWLGFAPGHADAIASRRAELAQQREQGLASLATLEQQHRAGTVDASRYQARRAALVAQLERVYGELDADVGAPGGQGIAS